jgi:hypothetical protein
VKKREKGCVGRIQKVGGCAESDRTEALGCQRTHCGPFTPSPPITPRLNPCKEVLVRKKIAREG